MRCKDIQNLDNLACSGKIIEILENLYFPPMISTHKPHVESVLLGKTLDFEISFFPPSKIGLSVLFKMGR